MQLLSLLAQSTTYTYQNSSSSGISAIAIFIYLAVLAFMIVAMWKVFEKAGKPGWASIVPIYNTIVQLEIVGRPIWWIVLMLIPVVNIVVLILLEIDLAKSFGKSSSFAVLLILLPIVGYPILAFGDAKYVGPAASGGTPTPAS